MNGLWVFDFDWMICVTFSRSSKGSPEEPLASTESLNNATKFFMWLVASFIFTLLSATRTSSLILSMIKDLWVSAFCFNLKTMLNVAIYSYGIGQDDQNRSKNKDILEVPPRLFHTEMWARCNLWYRQSVTLSRLATKQRKIRKC